MQQHFSDAPLHAWLSNGWQTLLLVPFTLSGSLAAGGESVVVVPKDEMPWVSPSWSLDILLSAPSFILIISAPGWVSTFLTHTLLLSGYLGASTEVLGCSWLLPSLMFLQHHPMPAPKWNTVPQSCGNMSGQPWRAKMQIKLWVFWLSC